MPGHAGLLSPAFETSPPAGLSPAAAACEERGYSRGRLGSGAGHAVLLRNYSTIHTHFRLTPDIFG